jgi:hypothetical protein
LVFNQNLENLTKSLFDTSITKFATTTKKTLELKFKAFALVCALSSSPLRRIDSTYLDGALARSILLVESAGAKSYL